MIRGCSDTINFDLFAILRDRKILAAQTEDRGTLAVENLNLQFDQIDAGRSAKTGTDLADLDKTVARRVNDLGGEDRCRFEIGDRNLGAQGQAFDFATV